MRQDRSSIAGAVGGAVAGALVLLVGVAHCWQNVRWIGPYLANNENSRGFRANAEHFQALHPLIAGAAVGAVAGALVLIVGVWVAWRRGGCLDFHKTVTLNPLLWTRNPYALNPEPLTLESWIAWRRGGSLVLHKTVSLVLSDS